MEFETKVLSRQIQEALYNHNETLGTAESCTGGRIAEAIISVPGASQYFKGGVVSYTNEVKENLLHVSAQVLAEQTAVCEEVAREMVIGACDVLNCDYAISATGVAGPGGGTAEIPVGTIWLGYGAKDDVRTFKLTENFGRDINLEIATNKALRLFLEYVNAKHAENSSQEEEK
ncbi:CinA family protein [Hallella absiana]|uniref:CinA family protein n=1 Tax=Hallella absiana TaxID=2925336 RepID=UPI0021C61582|nr:CinA family protein [Hallella absiana]